jgi:hypothetical protein
VQQIVIVKQHRPRAASHGLKIGPASSRIIGASANKFDAAVRKRLYNLHSVIGATIIEHADA